MQEIDSTRVGDRAPASEAASCDRFAWISKHPAPVRISADVINRFALLEDLSSTVSDVLDELGLVGAVGTSILKPTLPQHRVIGTAITVRNIEQRRDAYANVSERSWQMAEILALEDAKPGDVLLIEGVADVSNMGGLIATIAKRQGVVGAVVDGGVRDVGHSRGMDFPVWSRDISPVTGKWRCTTQEINGMATVAGISAVAGDLVIADETGFCVIPREHVEGVLVRCEEISRWEKAIDANIADGMPIHAIVDSLYGGKSNVSD